MTSHSEHSNEEDHAEGFGRTMRRQAYGPAPRERLWSMPHDERCAMLVCSIIERDPRGFDTPCNLLDLLMRLSQAMGHLGIRSGTGRVLSSRRD
ncbi:MAG: hypothetical protein ACM3Z4_05710 [Hyphomicrobiales bacterium]